MDFFIKTEHNILFLAVIIIVSVLISYFFYKKTKLARPQRIIFSVLRFLSIFFLLLLLASPVISLISGLTVKPLNVFLIDNSKSLTIENRNVSADSVLNNFIYDTENSLSDNRYFVFSGNLGGEIEDKGDSIPFYEVNNFETNLSFSLLDLEEILSYNNLSSVNIISDGIINSGGNPGFTARELNVPFNYYLLGDTTQKKDVVLKNTFYNKITFIESSSPIKIEINSYGYDEDIEVNLYEEGNLINTIPLRVTSESSIYNIDFNIASLAQGIKKYRVEIPQLAGEITYLNNNEEFFVKFIDNKFKVLVLSGGPGSDFAFIKEEMKSISNFETTFMTQKSANEFYEGAMPPIGDFQAIMLIGFPTSITSQTILSEIHDAVELNKSALIFFASRNTDYSKLKVLEAKLPFKISGASETEEETRLKTVSFINNEVFKNSSVISQINSLPPVFRNRTSFIANPSSETVLISTAGSEPAFVLQNTDDNKSAAMLAHGLYKWRLNPAKTNAGEILRYLITTTIINIADKEKQKKFTIETTRPVYSKYENVKFKASLNNSEVEGGEKVTVKISGNGFDEELELNKVNNFLFEGDINIPQNGDYNYTASLYIRDRFIESDKGRLSIGENNFEYKETRSDNQILSSLSNITGGENLNVIEWSKVNELIYNINNSSKDEIKSLENINLNINPYYLAGLILLLCLEWFFRKRNNLP